LREELFMKTVRVALTDRALHGAVRHLDIFGLPIDLWVVVVKAGIP
jgi:hypothetical protein